MALVDGRRIVIFVEVYTPRADIDSSEITVTLTAKTEETFLSERARSAGEE
jgi:hypothetical protein